MALATLSIDLVAKLASLEAGMSKAGRIAERHAQQMEARFAKVSAVAAGIGAALVASLSVGAIIAFANQTNQALLAVKDLSEATGSTIENISGLENVARAAGGSLADVEGVLIKFNAALKDADGKNGISLALKAIGLDAEQLRSLDPAEALRRTAVALAGFADDGNKARLVQELFGKSIKEAGPLLRELAEAGALNGTVTSAQVEQTDKFNKELAKLRGHIEDAGRSINSVLVPALNTFFDGLRGKEGSLAKALGLDAFEARVDQIVAAYRLLGVGIERATLQRAANIDSGLPNKNALAEIAALDAQGKALVKTFIDAGAAVAAVNRRNGGSLDGLPLDPYSNEGRTPPRPSLSHIAPIGGAKDKAEKPREFAPAPLDQATLDALKAIESTDVEKIARLNATLDELFNMRAGGLGGGVALDAAIQSVRDELAAIGPEARKAADEQVRLNAILAQTPQGQLKAIEVDLQLINAALDKGTISFDQWAQAVRVASSEVAKPELEKINEFAQQAGRNIQDALGDTLLRSMSGNFKSIGSLWRDLLMKMVAQAAAVKLGNALFGDSFAKTGDLGGFFGNLLKSFGTSHATGLNYVPYDGYPAVLHKGERVQTAAEARGYGRAGGASMVYSPTINVNGDVGPQTIAAMRGEIARDRVRWMRSMTVQGTV